MVMAGWQRFYSPRSSRSLLSAVETLQGTRLGSAPTWSWCIQRGQGAEFKDSPPPLRAGDPESDRSAFA